MLRTGIAGCGVVLLLASGATAGWLGDVVTGAGGDLGERILRYGADRAYERVLERRKGPDGESSPPPSAENGAHRRIGIRPGEVASGYDFVPGGRVLFSDDFRGTAPGGFPKRWTLKGPDANAWKAPLEVARYNGRNWARHRPSNSRKDVLSSFYIRMDAGKDLPERFTIEFDAVLPPFDGKDRRPEYRVLLINHGSEYRSPDYEAASSNVVRIGSWGASSGNTRQPYELGDGQVHRVSILVDGRSVKAYLDRELVVNDPAGVVRPVTVVGMELSYQTGADILPLMFTDFRLAAADAVTARTP